MRPNLMSPRRMSTSGEDSILAMLEREPARKRKPGGPGVRMAWYGAGAMLALVLTVTLVWMAANNDGLPPEVQETALADAPAAVLQVALSSVPAAPEAPAAPDIQAASPAHIVDGAPDEAPPAEAIPPLRLLKPATDQPAPDKPVPPSPANVALPARPVAKTSSPPLSLIHI